MFPFDWRSLAHRAAGLWRASLQLRTVALSVALSALAVGIIGAYISFSIGNNLFNLRLEQALDSAERSNLAAQARFDAAENGSSAELQNAMDTAAQAALQSASTSGVDTQTLLAILRSDGQSGPRIPINKVSPGLNTNAVIPDELVALVSADSPEKRLYWQSVSLERADGGVDPGIVVASALVVPEAKQYELYLVFNLRDTQENLAFVQQTLWIGGFALVLLIGAVTYIVVRLVVGPVRMAAETSERLAAGELEVRIPEKGEDVIATLARSFNGMADSLQNQIT